MKSRWMFGLGLAALVGLTGLRVASALERKANASALSTRGPQRVRAARAEKADFADRIAITGTVRPRAEVDVVPKLAGRIEKLLVEVGDHVEAGQAVAVIEHADASWQARASQAALAVARAQLQGARHEQKRIEALFQGGAAPSAQVDEQTLRVALASAQLSQAEAAAGLAREQLGNATLVAPFAGTVVRRNVDVGARVTPQSVVATIQDATTVRLQGSVDGRAYAALQKGSPARVTAEVLGAEGLPGRVTLIAPALDPSTRRAAITIELENTSNRLPPGTFATATIDLRQIKDAVAVPSTAVLETREGARVFRLREGRVELVQARLGPSDGARRAVLEGLEEGDLVATSGLSGLENGQTIEAVEDAGEPPPDRPQP